MKPHKIPSPKIIRARIKDLTDLGLKKNQLDFALWCQHCDFLYFPIREWPRQCARCKRHIRDGYHRVRPDGRIIVHFKGRKTLEEAFIGEEVKKE